MAGRPATGRGGGLTGLHYGLFVFVGLTVVVAVLAVIALTQVSDAKTAAANAQRQIAAHGSPPDYYASEASARGSTAFEVMNEDMQRVAKLVTGMSDAVGKGIEIDARRALADVAKANEGVIKAEDTMIAALQRLGSTLTEEKSKSSALAEELSSVQDENKNLNEQIKAARDEFTAQVAALNERIEQIEKQKNESMTDKDRQLTDLQGNLESNTQEANRLKQELIVNGRNNELVIARLQNQIRALQEELKALKPSSFDPEAILTKADGKILRAIPGSDVVYINLGGNDKLKVGMGFEVYSQTREVPKDLRGKASVEVVSISPSTAECRVTRTSPGQPIIEGDYIVNIAFERGRLPKFLVVGDFDLNYDGIIDYDGVEKVRSIIRQWGGQVTDKLDETTDFVVLGHAPDVPVLAEGEPVSSVVKALEGDKRKELGKFRELIEQARAMSIPVINQNQFLFLTGYSGDTIVVQK